MEKQKKGVRLEHISKIYNDPKTGKEFYAVQDTTLDIEPGTFVTLLGPSGCGKTDVYKRQTKLWLRKWPVTEKAAPLYLK